MICRTRRWVNDYRISLFTGRSCRSRAASGFTITELMIMVLIIGILAATAIWTDWGSTASSSLRVAVDQVMADMRFVQTQSIATASLRQISFTNGVRNYYMAGESKQLPGNVLPKNSASFSFNMLGEFASLNNGQLTLGAGSGSGYTYRRVQVHTVTSYIEEY